MPKIVDPDLLVRAASKGDLGVNGNVFIDTSTKQIYLKPYGELTTDGVTVQCLYSFLKEEWKNDDELIKYNFPMEAITPEQFEFINGWRPAENDNNETLYLLRDGGFAIRDETGVIRRAFFGCITLGNFHDPASDRAYYWQDPTDQTYIKWAHFTGPLNEVVEYYRSMTIEDENVGTGDGSNKVFYLKWTPVKSNSETVYVNGSPKTRGTDYAIDYKVGKITFATAPPSGAVITADYVSEFDYSAFFKIFLRIQGKKYSQASLEDIGVVRLTYQAYRFPLSNEIDLKIAHSDSEIDSNGDGVPDQSPYSNMSITYLPGRGFTVWQTGRTYNRDDVVQASNGRWYRCLNDNVNTNPVEDSDNWTIYEGERQIGTGYYPFNIIVDANVSGSGTNPVAEQIYEYVQFMLRQQVDIDQGAGTRIGMVADPLLYFVGDTLVTRTGVFIDDFSVADTNRIEFYDATGVKRTFPFVAVLRIFFNDYLKNDPDAVFAVFFRDPDGNPNSGDEFGTAGAIVVNDKDGNPMRGSVGGASYKEFTFDYDNNNQGGRTPGTDAHVVAVAIGLSTAQYVKAEGTITRSTQNTISLVAALERNYSNP